MKTSILLTALALLGLGSVIPLAASADETDDFIAKVTVDTEFELEAGKLALEKSQNKDVQSFAQQMVNNSTKTSTSLQALLQSKNMTPPKQDLDSVHQAMMDTLQALSGDAFNHQYTSMQINVQKEEAALFDNYSRSNVNVDMKSFAMKMQPVTQEQLNNASELQNNLAK